MSLPPDKKRSEGVKYTSMSFKMAAAIAGFSLGGYYADKALELSFPIFTLVLSLTGVFLAIYIVILETKR